MTKADHGRARRRKATRHGPRAIEAVFGFTAVGGGVIDHTFDRDGSGTAADDGLPG